MSGPADNYHFLLPAAQRPSEASINEAWYPGVQAYWKNCTTKRSVDPIFGIKAVVIHATAGSSSAGAVSVMKKTKDAASFHWLVPDENEEQHGSLVWACAPEARAAWHVRNVAFHQDVNGGETHVNHWSVGIEVVNLQENDPFSSWQIQATADIVRYCWAKYPNLQHVVSHAKLDPKRRSDPGSHFDWEHFKQLVLSGPHAPLPPLVLKATPLSELPLVDGASCCDSN